MRAKPKKQMKPGKMDVIKKLQIKYILTVVLILTVVFTALLTGVNLVYRSLSRRQNDIQLIQLINSNGKQIGRKSNTWSPFAAPWGAERTRNSFCVCASSDGLVSEILSDFPIHYTADEICALVTEVYMLHKERGTYNGMQFMVAEKEDGFLFAFVDTRLEANMQNRLMWLTILIFMVCILVSGLVAWLLSIWAIRPVREAFDKQKRFVADASHELKTPLSTIATNMDVLVSETGENKWTSYIRSEVERMSSLVKDLLYLAKCDSGATQYAFGQFDLSRAVMSAVLPFETTVFENEMTLESDIAPDIQMNGDERRIQQLVVILLDNAVKHSDKGAVISVRLSASGNRKVISVRNTGEGISPADQKRIFERFYRIDTSRNRETGGSGLGLSIAKSIADVHHAKLEVTSEQGAWTEFSLVI